MDIQKIRALAEVLTEHKLYELILEEKGEKLVLKHPSGKIAEVEQIISAAALTPSAVNAGSVSTSQHTAAPAYAETAPAQPAQAAQPEQAQSAEQSTDSPGDIMVTSPMVGVFYASPSPEQAAFAPVGQTVHEGDVLCIIEAMKLMNELTAEQSGVVVEVYCENGALVEFGQKLFKLRAE